MFKDQSTLTLIIWLALIAAAIEALITGRYSLAFVAFVTLGLSMVPAYVAKWARIRVPPSFMLAVVMFVGGTIFLGEVADFYNRFWWWDVVMHGGSAIGFGLVGSL